MRVTPYFLVFAVLEITFSCQKSVRNGYDHIACADSTADRYLDLMDGPVKSADMFDIFTETKNKRYHL